MDKKQTNNIHNNEKEFDLYEGINISAIIELILREKKLIVLTTILSVLISILYALSLKRVYEGRFQIVVSQKDLTPISIQDKLMSGFSSGGGAIGAFQELTGLGSSSNKITTEMEILKSPSVLKSVSDFVKEEKRKEGKAVKEWDYQEWVKSLTVSNIKNTTILNISYKDTSKKLILPVIKKISSEYQIYSGRERKRTLVKMFNYLEDQIDDFSKKSKISFQKAWKFASKEQLPFEMDQNNLLNIIDPTSVLKKLEIKAANEIRLIDENIKSIEELDNQNELIANLVLTLPAFKDNEIYESLTSIETTIAELKTNFTENDISIKKARKVKEEILKNIKRKSLIILKGKRIEAQSRINASTRPESVYLKYRDLLYKAYRDQSALISLENNLQTLNLELARDQDPWELISKPILMDRPVGIGKRQVVFTGGVIGIFFGLSIALYLDRKRGIIFNFDELKNSISDKLITSIKASEYEDLKSKSILIANKIIADNNPGEIALVSIDDEPDNYRINEFIKLLIKNLDSKKIIITKDLSEASICNNQVLLASVGKIKRSMLNTTKEQLSLQSKEPMGWIIFDSNQI